MGPGCVVDFATLEKRLARQMPSDETQISDEVAAERQGC